MFLGPQIHQPWCFFPCPSGFILQAVRGDRQTLLFSATFPERLRQADSHPVEDGRMLDYQPAEVLNWSDVYMFFIVFFRTCLLGDWESIESILKMLFQKVVSQEFQDSSILRLERSASSASQAADRWMTFPEKVVVRILRIAGSRSFSKGKMTDGLWYRRQPFFAGWWNTVAYSSMNWFGIYFRIRTFKNYVRFL